VAGRAAKVKGRTAVMNGQGKSDGPVVPKKSPNKAGSAAAEAMEGRGPAKGNTGQQNASRTQSRVDAPSELDRVRRRAITDKKVRFTTLFHHVTLERLRDAYHALSRNAAAGVDGMTWSQYAANLEDSLQDLHARLHRGAYRAKPSRRVFIPKADGRLRPLGIATLEDKIVQRAVVEVLNAIYETDFIGFSYGFRPGRRAHDALDALATGIRWKKVSWVLDADIRGYFDSIDHDVLRKFLEHRIADRRMLRLIQKWLKAGTLQDGKWTQSTEGSPQGATISPLLANVFLHYVFDLWAQQWRKQQASGDMIVVRYADDFVVGFEKEADARRFLSELRDRFAKFELELHPDKTRVLRFGKFAAAQRRERGQRKPETFDFLGFTHVCGQAKNGGFMLLRRTTARRLRTKLREIGDALKRRRHAPIPEQGAWLQRVVRGYFAYHAVPTNVRRLDSFRTQVVRTWLRALRRRGQRDRTTWVRMGRLATRWVPLARAQHPLPELRFDARTQGKSPVR